MEELYNYYYEYSLFTETDSFNVNVADTTIWRGLDIELKPPDWFTPVNNFLDSIQTQITTFLNAIITTLDIIQPIFETIKLVTNPIYTLLLELKALILNILDNIGDAGGFLLVILPEDKLTGNIKLDFWDTIGNNATTKIENGLPTENLSEESKDLEKKFQNLEKEKDKYTKEGTYDSQKKAIFKELEKLLKENKYYAYNNDYYVKASADVSTSYIKRKLTDAFNEDTTDNIIRSYNIPQFNDNAYVGGFGFMIGAPSWSEWLKYFEQFAKFFDLFKTLELLPSSNLPNLRAEPNKFIPEIKIVWDNLPSKKQDINKGSHIFIIDISRISEDNQEFTNFRIVETAETDRITSFIDCGEYIILNNIDMNLHTTYVLIHNDDNYNTKTMIKPDVDTSHSIKNINTLKYESAYFYLYGRFLSKDSTKEQFVLKDRIGTFSGKLKNNQTYTYNIQIYTNTEGTLTDKAKTLEENYNKVYKELTNLKDKLNQLELGIGKVVAKTKEKQKEEDRKFENKKRETSDSIKSTEKKLTQIENDITALKTSNKYIQFTDIQKMYEESILVYNDTITAKTPIGFDFVVNDKGETTLNYQNSIRLENGVWNGVSINTLLPFIGKFRNYCEELADLLISWYNVGDDIIDELFNTLEEWKNVITSYIKGFNFTLNDFLKYFKVVIKGFYYKYLDLGKGGNNRFLKEMIEGMPEYSPYAYVGAFFIIYGADTLESAGKQWQFIADLFTSSYIGKDGNPSALKSGTEKIWNNYDDTKKTSWDASNNAKKELLTKNFTE